MNEKMQKGQLGFDASAKATVYINATHPGAISTDQPQQAIEGYGLPAKIGVKMIRPFMADPVKQGCRSALWAATSEEVVEKGISGSYIVPDKKVEEPHKQARDGALGERLWKLSLELLRSRLGRVDYGYEV